MREHIVPKHYACCHNRDPRGTLFVAIDKYEAPWRGGSTKRGVSRLETKWIYELKSYSPHMIVEWDSNAFINNAWFYMQLHCSLCPEANV